jgi:hypothetical protein
VFVVEFRHEHLMRRTPLQIAHALFYMIRI